MKRGDALFVAAAALLMGGCKASGNGGGSADMFSTDPVVRGQFYVMERGCPTCHQSANAADGVLSGSTTPRLGTMAYPANLTPDDDTGIGTWTDELLFRAMRSGVDDQDEPLCPPMPHFDGTGGDGRPMGDDEAASIVAYLRSLPAVHHEIPDSVCPPLKPAPSRDMAVPAEDMAVPLPPSPDLGQPTDLASVG